MAVKRKKKRKSLSKRKRSLAAKKGWQTRRKRAQDRIFAANNPELVGIEDLVKEAEERGYKKALDERIAKAIVQEETRKGRVAKTPEAQIKARLRVVGGPDSDDYYEEVQELADEYGDEYTPTEIYTMGFY